MATNQAFCAIGVIFGYVAGALIVDLPTEYSYIDWRKGFAIQAFALFVIAAGFLTFDNHRLDIFGDRWMPDVPMNIELGSIKSKLTTKTRKEVATEKFGISLPVNDFRALIGIKVYFFTMMSLCAIYFSSTALQFWCTNYIITVLHVSPSSAHMIFGLSAITAPLLGTAVGGIITDSFVS
jgi:hypothetical protein